MVFIKVLKDWILNNEPTDYPKISIYSTSSKLALSVSSTASVWGKCFCMLMFILLNLKYLFRLLDISLDSVSDLNFYLIIGASFENCLHIFFYSKYNHTFLKQIEKHWNELQIDLDNETRKYFWTRKVIYYLLYTSSIVFSFIYDIENNIRTWPYSDADQSTHKSIYMKNSIHYWTKFIRFLTVYPYIFLEAFILFDLLVLSQTALKYIDLQLNRLYKASKTNERLNINVVHDLRLKYFLTHRLVNKMNEYVSPCLLFHCIIFLNLFVYILYFGLFVQQSLVRRLYLTIGYFAMIMNLFLIIYATVNVYTKSQDVLAMVYKLSFKADYSAIKNEISLFLNYDGIGFSLGGIIMITTASISTLFSFLLTIIIAIPSFDGSNHSSVNITSNKN
uniref:Gustatory receptor n=1 Tax=Tetranychus urticae TaxID=32264 RepID=T1KJE2_TETUR